MAKKTKVVKRTFCADGEHAVVTVNGRGGGNRMEPCEQCPWRADLPTGVFPAEAFRISAHTAYDGSMHQFGCHMSSPDHSQTCAGFLLRNADNNIGTRLTMIDGRYRQPADGGLPLYSSYREMAVANGVDPDDPVLSPCRDNGDL